MYRHKCKIYQIA